MPLVAVSLPALAGWWLGQRLGQRPTEVIVAADAPSPLLAARAVAAPDGSPAGSWMAKVRAAAKGTEFAALLEAWRATHKEDRDVMDAGTSWLFAQWVTRDPTSALAYVAGEEGAERNSLGSDLSFALGEFAPQEALKAARSSKDFPCEGFASMVWFSLAEHHPKLYLRETSLENLANENTPIHWGKALAKLAESDPQAAAQTWLEAAKNPLSLHAGPVSGLYATVAALTKRDSSQAKKWIENLPAGDLRRLAEHAWLGQLAKQDPQRAAELASVEALGNPDQMFLYASHGYESRQTDARVEIAKGLAATDLRAALEFAFSPEKFSRKASLTDVIHASFDNLPSEPAAFLAAVQAALPEGADDKVLKQFVEQKARHWNVEERLEAVKALANSPQSSSLRAAVDAAGMADAARTYEVVKSLPESQRARMMLELIGHTPAETLLKHPDMLSELPAMENPQIPAFEEDPASFAEIARKLPPTEGASSVQAAAVRALAANDPSAAAGLVADLPEASRAISGAQLAEVWAGRDETAASTWAATLPAGSVRDAAAASLTKKIATFEPEAAWGWAKSIQDPGKAAQAMVDLANGWGPYAPPEFRQAVVDAMARGGLSQKQGAAALEAIDPNLPPAK